MQQVRRMAYSVSSLRISLMSKRTDMLSEISHWIKLDWNHITTCLRRARDLNRQSSHRNAPQVASTAQCSEAPHSVALLNAAQGRFLPQPVPHQMWYRTASAGFSRGRGSWFLAVAAVGKYNQVKNSNNNTVNNKISILLQRCVLHKSWGNII